MASLEITLLAEGKKQTIHTRARHVVLGRGSGSNLRVPLPWLAERQLELRHEAGILRTRLLDADGVALLTAGERVGQEWTVLPHQCRLDLISRAGQLLIDLDARDSAAMAVVHDNPDDDDLPAAYTGAVIVGPDGHSIEEELPELPPAVELKPAGPEPVAAKKLRHAIMLASVLVVLIPLLLLGYSSYRSYRVEQQQFQAHGEFRSLIARSLKEMNAGEYRAAKATLGEAEDLARRMNWPEEIEEVKVLMRRPEIQYGANGFVLMHAKWVEPSVAAAWHDAEQQLDPQITRLLDEARQAVRESNFSDARASCAQAMALMDRFPEVARPHPRLQEAREIDKQAKSELLVAEMTAKGLVYYADRWMTPEQKFDLEQEAKGLVKYKGQWMTEDEATAARNTDQGLVLHDGKWMTPDEKMIAQGYVRFEGEWITRQRRDEILLERSQQRREQERERLAALAAAEERRRQQLAIEELKEDAYVMSQKFLTDRLKHPDSARFEPYSSPLVTVVYSNGWYLVRAPVRAKNDLGETVTRQYLSKLRPVGGGIWETDLTTIIE